MRKITAIWKTRHGGSIRVCDMTDSHLLNTMRMLEKRSEVLSQEAVDSGYAVLSSMNGEMAQYSIESDLREMEENGVEVEEFFPVYAQMRKEAWRRGLM